VAQAPETPDDGPRLVREAAGGGIRPSSWAADPGHSHGDGCASGKTPALHNSSTDDLVALEPLTITGVLVGY